MLDGWHGLVPKFISPAVGPIISLDTTKQLGFTWIPAEAETINALSPGNPGETMIVRIQTSGTTSFNLTFTGNFSHSAGVLATGVVSARFFTMLFYSDGAGWNELSRSIAMV